MWRLGVLRMACRYASHFKSVMCEVFSLSEMNCDGSDSDLSSMPSGVMRPALPALMGWSFWSDLCLSATSPLKTWTSE